MPFWRELRRRNVFKVGAAYAIVGWLLMQVAAVGFTALKLPEWTVTFATALIVLGFPIALLLAWAYEVTPEGVKRTQDIPLGKSAGQLSGSRINTFVTALLVVAVAVMAANQYLPGGIASRESASAAAPAPGTGPVSFVVHAPKGSRFSQAPADPHPALSPDGRQLAFIAPLESATDSAATDPRTVIWVQALGELEARPLMGTTGGMMPFWSPDGRSIGYFTQGGLKRIAASGDGVPQELAANASFLGGTWSPDGTIVYTARDGLYAVPAEGGEPRQLTTIDTAHGETAVAHRYPVMLPDGRRYLYLVLSSQSEAQGLYLGSLDDPQLRQRIVGTDSNGALGTGSDGGTYLFFVRDRAIVAQPFDLASGTLARQPTVMARPVQSAQSMRFAAFAAGGRSFVYRPRFDPETRLVWVDRHGVNAEPIPTMSSSDGFVALSPDGTKLAWTRIDRQTDVSQVWWRDLDRNVESRLTSGSDGGYFPVWSPDGSRVVYASPRAAVWNVYARALADSTREETVLAASSPVAKYPHQLTRDGRYLLFQGDSLDLWTLPLVAGGQARALDLTPSAETRGQVSPDGRWLAFDSTVSGESAVYVSAFPEVPGQQRVSTAGGVDPQWRADGRELYYLAEDNVLMAVEVAATDGATFEHGQPQPLFRFEPDPTSRQFGSTYAPAPDGQRFLLTERVGPAQPELIVTLNWQTD